MPRIFDNIQSGLLPALQNTLQISERADFCVGYFNLRGWGVIDSLIEQWAGGDGACCRLLVGMQTIPQDELKTAFRQKKLGDDEITVDQATTVRLKKRMAEEFREQLTIGTPTNRDEAALRRLSNQLKEKKVVVKLFLRYNLHAKLYLCYRTDPNNPITGFLGSSNLTFAGLQHQGELNIDVVDSQATERLADWFEERWSDRWCMDISEELAQIIDESWAREQIIPPYYMYLKIAYHLSQEARAGLSEFRIPKDFGDRLFEFQKSAVKVAAHHINKRGGVLIGDVVGLGKTLMATTLARIFQDDYSWETLIICPPNLVSMWEDYKTRYRLIADILPISQVEKLDEKRRYRLVLIDESHNLRNREGKRYRHIHRYIEKNESRCILLTATPYNKTYLDLSAQLRLFIPEDRDLGLRPEHLIAAMSEVEFMRRYQCGPRTLAAFEKSEYVDDWRELMRLFMVRRTRSFIQQNYAIHDPEKQQNYLTLEDGSRSYFPLRKPLTIAFPIHDQDSADPYARLYDDNVVTAINDLYLPRYGLGNYLLTKHKNPPTQAQAKIIEGLSRSGKRLMGFCRTNLFKRLESGGPAFIQSLERHAMRNFITLYALEQNLHVPIGAQDAELLDARITDKDADAPNNLFDETEETITEMSGDILDETMTQTSEQKYKEQAAIIYNIYATREKHRFKWLPAAFFAKDLAKHLLADAQAILKILDTCGIWNAAHDAKFNELARLVTTTHANEKILVFTQFADTAQYIFQQMQQRGIDHIAIATGDVEDPTALVRQFSPASNDTASIPQNQQIRVLITTDVLSEGQNLQDCSIIVNYDLPWAIIRLAQRAGRVDRIGQQSDIIRCYSFLPADGVERLIGLRSRVRKRLNENREVVGTDEAFFEDELNTQTIIDIYNEKNAVFDSEIDTEVDLASQAYQIWKNATDARPELLKTIPTLPPVVYSTRNHIITPTEPEGVLVYMRTSEGNDSLAWVNTDGQLVTQSQFAILRKASCSYDEQGYPRSEKHHELVEAAMNAIANDVRAQGGQLGSSRGARYQTYYRLEDYIKSIRGTLWEDKTLEHVHDQIYHFPLRSHAADTLNRQLRLSIQDQDLARLVRELYEDDKLCVTEEERENEDPAIICSLGLFAQQ